MCTINQLQSISQINQWVLYGVGSVSVCVYLPSTNPNQPIDTLLQQAETAAAHVGLSVEELADVYGQDWLQDGWLRWVRARDDALGGLVLVMQPLSLTPCDAIGG